MIIRRFHRIFLVAVGVFLCTTSLTAIAKTQVERQLFDQILAGEATFRDDIVVEAINKLRLIDPSNLQLFKARIALNLRQGKIEAAEKILQQLKKKAPHSPQYKAMKILIEVNKVKGATLRFQANVLALSGKYSEAKQILDNLYQGKPPTMHLAIEYWLIVAEIPKERPLAIKELMVIYQQLKSVGVIHIQQRRNEVWVNDLQKNIARAWVNEGEKFVQQKKIKIAQYQFQQALNIYPNSYFAYVGFGDITFEKKQFAKAKRYYEKALQLDPSGNLAHYGLIAVYEQQSPQRALKYIKSLSPFLQKKLESGARRLQSKILQFKAAQYIQSKQWQKALGLYKTALELYPNDIWVTFDLANVYAKLGQFSKGEFSLKEMVSKQPKNPVFTYVYALFHFRQDKNTRALQILSSLPKTQWNQAMIELALQIEIAIYKNKITELVKKNQIDRAVQLYQKIMILAPDDIWLVYDFSKILSQIGQRTKAIALFDALSLRITAEQKGVFAYAYALFLSSIDKNDSALRLLKNLPKSLWSEDIGILYYRLQDAIFIEHATALRAKGMKEMANDFLMRQRPSIRIVLTLARWALDDGAVLRAQKLYLSILQQNPNNTAAYIGLVNSEIADNNHKKALSRLKSIQTRVPSMPMSDQREIANAWMSINQPKPAREIFKRITRKAKDLPPSDDSALIFRDAGKMEVSLVHPKIARKFFEQAMVHSNITNQLPANDESYTKLTLSREKESWLKRGIRSDAATLYKQQSHIATIEQDLWRLKGAPGRSDYSADDKILHVRKPYRDGIFYVRGDLVALSAGKFLVQNGVFVDELGTCEVGCTRDFKQASSGIGLMVGWHNDDWNLNFGVTPIGFDIVNPIVDVGYTGKFNKIDWTVSALHTPLTNSLLSFAGTRDPNTGITWGGVTSTGLNLSLSYDQGGRHGLWGNALVSDLRGKNVANNYRIELMGGYYYKIINEVNRRLSLGLSSLAWHYNKDLNRYTLGSGGYFSPQKFITFSLPVSYRHRTQNWSLMTEASIGWNNTKTNEVALYPIPSIIPSTLISQNQTRPSSSAQTLSYFFLFGLERRLTSHFRLGGVVDIQRTPDFSPNHMLVYLRYSLEPWQGDLDMPLLPLPPLTNYR